VCCGCLEVLESVCGCLGEGGRGLGVCGVLGIYRHGFDFYKKALGHSGSCNLGLRLPTANLL